MTVHAHPDDETVFTGGILARYAAEGVQTIVVTCTGGEVGEISDPALATPETLGNVRAGELAGALKALNVGQGFSLGYRDSGMIGTAENGHAGCFWQANLDEATGKLVSLIRTTRPDVLVTYDERGNYGHPDHINAHRITVLAFERAGNPAWYPDQELPPHAPAKLYVCVFPRSRLDRMNATLAELGIENPWQSEAEGPDDGFWRPDTDVTARIDVAAHLSARRAAFLAHRTQFAADDFTLTLPDAVTEQLWGTEFFGRLACRVDAPDQEDDLFAGLRGP